MATIVKLKTKKRIPDQSERRQLFCEIVDRLLEYDLGAVAKESGVSYSTLYNWCYGSTKSPLLRTVLDVAEAIEVEIQMVCSEDIQKTARALKKKQAA